MINQRLRLYEWAPILQILELLDDLGFNFIIIFTVIYFLVSFNFDCELHDVISLINQLLEAFFLKLELDSNIASIDTLLKALYSTTDICVCVDQFSFVEFFKLFLLLIWENNVTSESLSHE
jgi:hypothetical protein